MLHVRPPIDAFSDERRARFSVEPNGSQWLFVIAFVSVLIINIVIDYDPVFVELRL